MLKKTKSIFVCCSYWQNLREKTMSGENINFERNKTDFGFYSFDFIKFEQFYFFIFFSAFVLTFWLLIVSCIANPWLCPVCCMLFDWESTHQEEFEFCQSFKEVQIQENRLHGTTFREHIAQFFSFFPVRSHANIHRYVHLLTIVQRVWTADDSTGFQFLTEISYLKLSRFFLIDFLKLRPKYLKNTLKCQILI